MGSLAPPLACSSFQTFAEGTKPPRLCIPPLIEEIKKDRAINVITISAMGTIGRLFFVGFLFLFNSLTSSNLIIGPKGQLHFIVNQPLDRYRIGR